MESLLKLSGILNEEGEDVPDLEKMKERFLADKIMLDGSESGTLERKLADKAFSQSSGDTPTRTPTRSSKSGSQPRTFDSRHHTPQMDRLPVSRDSVASPAEVPQEKGEPVEELSDMMCSLVTNNCGETRYIGMISSSQTIGQPLTHHRIVLRLLHFLSQRHTMGQRKDWRQLFSRHDRFSRRERDQMEFLET